MEVNKGGSLKPREDFFNLEGELVSRYVWASQFVFAMTVIDIGCGAGYGSNYLAQSGAMTVTGIDSDLEALRLGRTIYQRKNLTFLNMDACNITFPSATFDIAVSFEVIEHLIDASEYLKGVSKVLKSSGIFLISSPNKGFTEIDYLDAKPRNHFHVREYYPKELCKLLEGFFKIKGIYYQCSPYSLIEAHRELDAYLRDTRIPRGLARHAPRRAKDAWLRMRGINPPKSTRGRWRDFEIAQVAEPNLITERHQVQMFLCGSKE